MTNRELSNVQFTPLSAEATTSTTIGKVWKWQLPPLIGVQEFHDLAHGIASTLTPPSGLSTHDVGQLIKTKILAQLPPDVFDHVPAKWPESFFYDGTFDFPKPIPREVLLAAMEAAGLAIKATDELELSA